MKKILLTVALALSSAGVGLATAWFAAEQTHAHQEDAHGAAPKEDEGELEFDVQTLAKLGVRIAEPELVQASEVYEVAARVTYAADSAHVIAAPFEGDVLSVDKSVGAQLRAGESVVSVVRTQRPVLETEHAAPLLATINEELHASYAELRVAHTKVETLRQELARLDAIDAASADADVSLVERERLIQLRYEHRRARSAYEALSHKLEAHGVRASQVDAIARGTHPPHGTSLWKGALQHHGLWSERSDEILARLPEGLRAKPQSIAALGELAARGFLDAELNAAVAKLEGLRDNFLEAARLRANGSSVARLRWLTARGALDATMRLRVPPAEDDGARVWIVESLSAQQGERVAPGRELARLRDASRVQLELEPIGDEVHAVRSALAQGLEFSASPVLPQSAEPLRGLRVASVLAAPGRADKLIALAPLDNAVSSERDDAAKTWQLYPGMRYRARLEIVRDGPQLARVPREAIVRRGSRALVYGLGHGHAHDYEVVVVKTDSDFAYLEPSAIPAGEKIAVRGALALSLAIERASSGGQGHGHPH